MKQCSHLQWTNHGNVRLSLSWEIPPGIYWTHSSDAGGDQFCASVLFGSTFLSPWREEQVGRLPQNCPSWLVGNCWFVRCRSDSVGLSGSKRPLIWSWNGQIRLKNWLARWLTCIFFALFQSAKNGHHTKTTRKRPFTSSASLMMIKTAAWRNCKHLKLPFVLLAFCHIPHIGTVQMTHSKWIAEKPQFVVGVFCRWIKHDKTHHKEGRRTHKGDEKKYGCEMLWVVKSTWLNVWIYGFWIYNHPAKLSTTLSMFPLLFTIFSLKFIGFARKKHRSIRFQACWIARSSYAMSSRTSNSSRSKSSFWIAKGSQIQWASTVFSMSKQEQVRKYHEQWCKSLQEMPLEIYASQAGWFLWIVIP